MMVETRRGQSRLLSMSFGLFIALEEVTKCKHDNGFYFESIDFGMTASEAHSVRNLLVRYGFIDVLDKSKTPRTGGRNSYYVTELGYRAATKFEGFLR